MRLGFVSTWKVCLCAQAIAMKTRLRNRTHLSLEKDAPDFRAREEPGRAKTDGVRSANLCSARLRCALAGTGQRGGFDDGGFDLAGH